MEPTPFEQAGEVAVATKCMGEAPVAVPEVATLALAGDDTYTPARDGTVIAMQTNRRAEAFERFILASPAKSFRLGCSRSASN